MYKVLILNTIFFLIIIIIIKIKFLQILIYYKLKIYSNNFRLEKILTVIIIVTNKYILNVMNVIYLRVVINLCLKIKIVCF